MPIEVNVTNQEIEVSTSGQTVEATVTSGIGPVGPTGPQGPPGTTDYLELDNVPSEFTPAAHAATHEPGGSDELFDQSLNAGDTVNFGGVNFPNGTSITTGTFDLGLGGYSGVSINCAVGYELNWQAGRLRSTADSGATSAIIYADSPFSWESEAGSLSVASGGITFPDATQQTTAWLGAFSYNDLDDVPADFPPEAHTHSIEDVTGLEDALGDLQPSGDYATLVDGTVPSAQLPSYVDDVLEYANQAAFPGTGETGKIYVALDTNKVYRWSGSAYVEISPSPGSTDSVTEGSVNLYFTNARAAAAAPVQSVAGRTGAVTISSTDVSGLGSLATASTVSWSSVTSTPTTLPGYGITDAVSSSDSRLSDARTPTSHTHGNITNAGAIGSTSGLPIITTASGVLNAGAFGTSAGQFAEGNHTHSQLHDRSHAITSSSDHTATAWRAFYSNGSGVVTELTLGASGTVLQSGGTCTAPSWLTLATVATSASASDLSAGTLALARLPVTVEQSVAVGNSGANKTLSLSTGSVQTVTLSASCTFTMPTATAGTSLTVILTQGSNYTATFTSVKWPGGTAPTITATANAIDILTFVSDGTNWYGVAVRKMS